MLSTFESSLLSEQQRRGQLLKVNSTHLWRNYFQHRQLGNLLFGLMRAFPSVIRQFRITASACESYQLAKHKTMFFRNSTKLPIEAFLYLFCYLGTPKCSFLVPDSFGLPFVIIYNCFSSLTQYIYCIIRVKHSFVLRCSKEWCTESDKKSYSTKWYCRNILVVFWSKRSKYWDNQMNSCADTPKKKMSG